MALKIDASGLLSRHYLLLTRNGFKFYQAGMFWGARRFTFREVDAVVMSPTHQLSFQVGQEIFSIPTQPAKAKHQAAIKAFLEGLENSRLSAGSAVRYASSS